MSSLEANRLRTKKLRELLALHLEEVHEVVKHLQGELLTFVEAIYPEGSQRKAIKDTVNSQVSRALSYAQDIAWGRHDSDPRGESGPCYHAASHPGSCEEFDESQPVA